VSYVLLGEMWATTLDSQIMSRGQLRQVLKTVKTGLMARGGLILHSHLTQTSNSAAVLEHEAQSILEVHASLVWVWRFEGLEPPRLTYPRPLMTIHKMTFWVCRTNLSILGHKESCSPTWYAQVQEYLAQKKTHPPRTLPWAYT
jgi:hypothetical protein